MLTFIVSFLCSLLYSSAVRSTLVLYFFYLPFWIPNSCLISLIAFFLLNNIKTTWLWRFTLISTLSEQGKSTTPIWTAIWHLYLNINLTYWFLTNHHTNLFTQILQHYLYLSQQSIKNTCKINLTPLSENQSNIPAYINLHF